MAEEAVAGPITREQAEAFLAELAALTMRHGISLWSCGCCGGINMGREARPGRYEASAPTCAGGEWDDVNFVGDAERVRP